MRDIRFHVVFVLVLVGLTLCSSPVFAQRDTFGKLDTCRVVVFQDEKGNQAMASVSIFNDEDLAAMTIPFRFGTGTSPIRCDSVRFRRTRTEDFDMKTQLVDTVRQTVLIGLVADMSGQKPPLAKGDGEVARIYFTLPKSAKFQDVFIDTSWVRPFNVLKFVTPDVKSVFPVFDNSRGMIKGGIPIPPSAEKKSDAPTKDKGTEKKEPTPTSGTEKK
jgi:hypothetical protein